MFWNWKCYIVKLVCCGMLAVSLATGVPVASAQAPQGHAARVQRALPQAAEQALAETNRASLAELSALDRNWRDIFRASRHRETLKGFVGETLGLFEKLRQVHDFAVNPGGTDVRVTALFRKQIMDADTVCGLLDKSLADYCRRLDEQDQALFIKLKIDREAGRTSLSRSVIDPASFKKPIHAAASAAVVALQNDMARSIAAFAASEAIGAGVKQAARDFGLNRTEEGSIADFITGLVIDLGINAAVDAATDPTPGMVADLETRLQSAERTILDGTIASPGFINTLRRITEERAAARRLLLEAELLK